MLDFGELTVFASTAAVFTLIIFFWNKRNGKKDAGKRYPPSSSFLPLILAIYRGGMSVLPEYFMKSAKKLGPVYSFNLGGRLMIILNGKEAITAAYLRQSETFADKPEMWTEKNLVNRQLQGIIFSRYDNAFKKYHKQCLVILKEFGFGVNSVSETRILREVESLKEEILKYNGRPFNPKLLMIHSTFNVVCSILFGETFLLSDSCHRISESVNGFVTKIDFAIDLAPILRFLPVFKKKLSICEQHHKDLIEGIEEGIKHSKASDCEATFISRFIDIQGSNYDYLDLLYILRDLCLGSAETVSTSLQWAMVELANHPEVQTRFQQELDEIVPKDRLPSLDDKLRLPYTDAVILEVMRRHTLVPLLVHATIKDTEVFGYSIPEGSMVIANATSTHMDLQSWIDPENFRPERFLNKDGTITESEKVIAFGLGKRSCLGEILGRQELFLFLTSFVQLFDIRPPEGQDSIRVTEVVSGVIQPSEFEVRLIPRTKIKNY